MNLLNYPKIANGWKTIYIEMGYRIKRMSPEEMIKTIKNAFSDLPNVKNSLKILYLLRKDKARQ